MFNKSNNYFYNKIATPEPPDYLLDRIMARINKEQRLASVRRRLILYALTTGVSFAGFVSAVNLTRNDLLSSGFLQFASLIFSDFKIVASYSQNYFMSLLESFPATSLLLSLTTIFILLMSLKLIAQNIKGISAANKLASV